MYLQRMNVCNVMTDKIKQPLASKVFGQKKLRKADFMSLS